MGSKAILVFLSLAALVLSGFSGLVSNSDFNSEIDLRNISSKASGINLSPSGFEFQYANNGDFQSYGLLSSYDCCDTVNRPEYLWIVDGMVDKEQQIGINIQNLGSTASGQFDLRVYVEHNEYDEFIIFDQITQVATIAGSSSKMVYLNWIPDYSGNHTIRAVTQHPQDDDISNDIYSRHYTVGSLYENANSAGMWASMSAHWAIDTDTGITPHDSSTFYRNSFYVGDMSTTSYGNNWVENMDSSTLNFGDRVSNPVKSFKISFLLSGASKTGDNLYLKIENSPGSWKTLGTINAIIDSTAANWNLFNYNVLPSDMNSNSKLRLSFTSNAAGTDSGYWVDDFVMVYDQAARPGEYNPKLLTVSGGQTSAEEWSEHDVQILNDGNLEDKLTLDITDLPQDWDWTVSYKNGGPIDPQIGIEVAKDSTKNLTIRVKPSSNSTLGQTDLNLRISSANSPSSGESKQFQLNVLPTYLPHLEYGEEEGVCRPGLSCEIYATLSNDGDVSDSFEISTDILILRTGWTFDLSWNQPTNVELESGESTAIRMTVDIPLDTIPGQYSSLMLTATSDTRSDIFSRIRVNATAGMVSIANFAVDIQELDYDVISPLPGTTVDLPFTLWNNASTFDTFEVCIITSGSRSWTVSSENLGMIIEEESECTTPHVFDVPGLTALNLNIQVSIPENAQSGDNGPLLIPIVRSSKSAENISSVPFNDFSVRMITNLELRDLVSNNYLSPGSENILTFNISNDGNGADEVLFNVGNFVYEWEYWFSDGEDIIETIELSPSYEGNNVAQIYLHLFVPNEVAGETSVNFEVSIISNLYSTESDFSDNVATYTGFTAMVFNPEWVIPPIESTVSEADRIIELNATMINTGNSFDSQLKVKFEIEINKPANGLSSVLSIPTYGDEYYPPGQWVSTPLDKDQLARIEIMIIIPSEIQIPTELVITWHIEGGTNQLGESTILTNSTTIDISIYRSIAAELGISPMIVSPSSFEYFSINFTSKSSIIEDLSVEYTIPEGWFFSCEDPSNDGEFRIVIPAAIFGSSRTARMDCSLQIGDSSGLKAFNLTLFDLEGNEIQSWDIEFAVQAEEEVGFISSFFAENGVLKGMMITFACVIFVLLGILILQRKDEYEEYEEESKADVVQYQQQYSQPQQQYSQPQQQYSQPQQHFSQPASRPPSEKQEQSLEDAFGSLMPGKIPEDENSK